MLAYEGKSEEKNKWYLDTRVSNHMCGFKNIYMELDDLVSVHVTFEDASKNPVKGKGKTLIRLKNERH